jgi:L-asparaginase
MDAVEAAAWSAELLEDDPLYNAGKGSKIQSDGHIRMSAALMDGSRRRFGGCVNVEGVKNPIRLAQVLMERKDRVLSGDGARRLARAEGLAFASPFTEHQRAHFSKKRGGKSGTIGAVALDRRGRLAAATSTGGRGMEYPYRVSDSPTVAGCFATENCAVSATGVGEQIVEQAVAATLCAWVDLGVDVKTASQRLRRQALRRRAEFGWIALGRHGEIAHATTTESLIWASVHGKSLHLP